MTETETTPNTETSQTVGSESADKEETYTKAQLTELIQKEIGKNTAKHSKKIDALQAELEAERKKSLPDPEKVKLDLQQKEDAIKQATAKIEALEARDRKRAALDAAKLTLPADITLQDLLDMMPANDDEAIEGYIQKFKKMFPASKGLGTSTTTGDNTAAPSLDDEIAALTAKVRDPTLSKAEKFAFADRLASLHTKKMIEDARKNS
jgi:hypothetical protein